MRDPNCIFCKIIDGGIPAVKVLETPECLAFLDIGPLAEGHVLLIPSEHFETIDQMPAELAAPMLAHLPRLVRGVRAATGCQGVNILQNNGAVAHQEVMHVHFHIIPRKAGDAFRFNWPAGKYPQGRIEQLAEAIRRKLE